MELLRDLVGDRAAVDERQDLDLPLGERAGTAPECIGGQLRVDDRGPGGDAADGVHKTGRRRRLHEVAGGPGLQGAMDVPAPEQGYEEKDLALGELRL